MEYSGVLLVDIAGTFNIPAAGRTHHASMFFNGWMG
jgi:hypothetical protein